VYPITAAPAYNKVQIPKLRKGKNILAYIKFRKRNSTKENKNPMQVYIPHLEAL